MDRSRIGITTMEGGPLRPRNAAGRIGWARRLVRVRLVALLAALAVGAGGIGGCGVGGAGPAARDGGADVAGDEAAASDGSGFPLTIKHAFGRTTIEEKPKRIVTLGEDLDTLAALGITPVGYAPTAPGYTDNVPYLEDRIDLSGSQALDGAEMGEFQPEQIARLKPDLILGTNLATMEKLYDRLSQIAPTIGYETGWGETRWQEMSLTIGRAVGAEGRARRAVRETERYLADLRDELPGLAGKTVAGAYYYQSATFASNPHSASMDKFIALGMKVSPTLLRQLPEGSTNNTVTLERIDVLDADLLMLSFGSAELQGELENHPLYRALEVVKQDHVHKIDIDDRLPTFAGNNPTLLNIPWLLDGLKDSLAEVAGSDT